MGVSRSAYYDYVRCTDNCSVDPCHEEILETVLGIAKFSDHSYGSRRIAKALNALGYPVGRWKARSLMREAGVQVRHRKKYKITTDSKHKQPVFENKLNRQFDVAAPNQVYVGDITYIWTREGWLYLAVVIAQYASRQYRRLLKIHGFTGSMSRLGNCWDNSVAESFFGSLKQERVQWRHYQTRHAAQQDVLQYISMFYNSHRLHSYLGYKSPNQYEVETEMLKRVA